MALESRAGPIIDLLEVQGDDKDFAFHLNRLFDLAAEADKSRHDTKLMLLGVVDFSQAQLKLFNGFLIDYCQWRMRLMAQSLIEPQQIAMEIENTDSDCEIMLRGCTFHFEQSVIRIRRIAALTTKMTTSIDLSPNRIPGTTSSAPTASFDIALTPILCPARGRTRGVLA
ncbi:hypothetical protein V8E36_004949 [Tilletia maclaganii]